MDAVLRLEVELAVGHLDSDGNQYGVVGYFHEIRAPSELQLVADNARGHNRFEVLELDIGRFLHLGVKFQAIEFIHACRRSAHGRREVGAVGARKAVCLGGQAHRFQQAQAGAGHVQQGILFRRIHSQVIFTRTARIHELQNNVLANSFQITPPPSFPWIGGGRAPAFFHRPIVGTARGVGIYLICWTPHDVHATTVRFPARNPGGKVLVGVSDAAVVLFFKIVVRKIGIAAAPQPELLDKLLALFIGIKLQEGIPFFWRNDIDHVLVQPLFVLAVEFFEGLARFLFLLFALLFGKGLRRRRIYGILGLLSPNTWNKDGKRECSSNQGTNYPWHWHTSTSRTTEFYPLDKLPVNLRISSILWHLSLDSR